MKKIDWFKRAFWVLFALITSLLVVLYGNSTGRFRILCIIAFGVLNSFLIYNATEYIFRDES